MLNGIERIELAGYKSLARVDLELGDLNVLIGANGAGKSNFLSVFKLLNALTEQRLQTFVGRQGGASALLYHGPKRTQKMSLGLHFRSREGTNTYRAEFTHVSPDVLMFTDEMLEFKFLHEDAGNLAAFLYMLRRSHPGCYEEIRETLKLAFPLFDDFVLEPSRLNSNKILLTWRERGSTQEFGPHQLSDGTLRFTCLATLLLQPFNHHNAPYTITIDEPELGLHPYAITLLASMLRSASERVQLIVSTQSASLLGAIEDPDAVIVVERGGDGASELKRLRPGEISHWLEEYSLGDVWEKGIIGGRPRP